MSSVESVSIQPIDKTTVNQICSGQVVLNLATAVKELLENSIDAGADSVQIKLEEYGSESIEVIDNGCGIEEVNFQALTLKHHTSKIREFSDLYSVETFGFRGEALSSLCALSNVTIITQHKNADIGATLKFDHNGIITSNLKTSRKTGTTVRIENLFNTLPIRRTEFLRNLKREYSRLCNVLYAYGLISKGIRISCTNNVYKSKLTTKEIEESKTKRLTTSIVMDTKGESLESNIVSIFGIKQKQNLLKITEKMPTQETLNEFNVQNKSLNLPKFKINGYISSCAHGYGRASSDRQFYYINSRPVDNPKISKLVNEIYHQFNNRQDPFVVLNISVACGSFDMNVTPDKRLILLQNEMLLLAVLKESFNATFQNIPSTMQIQNVRLISELTTAKNMREHEGLEKFQAPLKSSFDKIEEKEQPQLRIDSSSKRGLEIKNSTEKTIFLNREITKNYFPESEVKTESLNSTSKNETLVHSIPEKNFINIQKRKKNQNTLDDEIKFTLDAQKNLESEKNIHEISKDQELVLGNLVDASAVLRQNKEVKRKELLERFQPQNTFSFEETEESDSKRMKFDEGLTEEVKKKRKVVNCNITLSEIKKSGLTIAEKNLEKTGKNSTVKFLSEIKPQNNERAENELKKELKKESFQQMEIIGQFNLGFIISKLGPDVFIIDQHASDEKYNYETLQMTTVMQTQRLFNPEKLELTVDKEELMLQHEKIFKKNGFDFVFDKDAPSTRRISLTCIPMSKNYVFGKDDVDELLFLLEDAADINNIRPSKINSMFASRACRKSVMIGTPLDKPKMRKIVDHMGEVKNPWNCPHGRPTIRHLVNLEMICMKE